MKFLSAAAVALCLSAGATAALAHGVGVRVSSDKPVALEFYYSTGETMSYAETQVFSPADPKTPYQEGSTDDMGHFAFVPNADGDWKVVVSQEGHRAEGHVNVKMSELNSGTASAAPAPQVSGSSMPSGAELARNAVLGVSLLFNIGVAVVLIRRRRKAA